MAKEGDAEHGTSPLGNLSEVMMEESLGAILDQVLLGEGTSTPISHKADALPPNAHSSSL